MFSFGTIYPREINPKSKIKLSAFQHSAFQPSAFQHSAFQHSAYVEQTKKSMRMTPNWEMAVRKSD